MATRSGSSAWSGGPSGCGNRSSHLPFVGLHCRAPVVTFACFLCPDRSVDLPLVMLFGLPEYGQEHDRPLRSTPVRDPGRNIAQPDPQLPDRSLQVIGPRAAQFGALFGEHAALLPMLHESFWVVVGTAAPVIALAAIVAFTDIARVAGEVADKFSDWDPKTRDSARRQLILGYLVGLINVVMQAAAVILALLSLAASHDQVPLIVLEITTSLGIILLAVSGLITVSLRFTEPEFAPSGGGAQGSAGEGTDHKVLAADSGCKRAWPGQVRGLPLNCDVLPLNIKGASVSSGNGPRPPLSTPGMGDRLGVKVPWRRGGANSEPEATASSCGGLGRKPEA